MPISSSTVEAFKALSRLVLCPVCGKFEDNMKIESLMSCGHHLCNKCVKKFVINANNKCPKCYSINNNSDIKDDNFMTNLSKFSTKLNQMIDKNISHKNKNLKQIQSECLPKCGPKAQKDLIIESLKCCTSSVVKTKLNNKVIHIELKNKKIESRPKPQTMTDFDYDPNKEYIPDSYEFTQESNQNNNELKNKLNEIETDLQSISSNGDHNQIKAKEGVKEMTKSANNAKSSKNVGNEQKSEMTSGLKIIEERIPKKNLLEPKSKQNYAKTSTLEKKSNEIESKRNEKKKEKSETMTSKKFMDNYSQVELFTEEKWTQAEDQKAKTVSQGIQVKEEVVEQEVQCVVDKCDAFAQTDEPFVEQTDGCHPNNCCLHKKLTQIQLELNNCPELNLILNTLLNKEIVNNVNQTSARNVNSVQENESVFPKNEGKSTADLKQLENLMETNENTHESDAKSEEKILTVKKEKRQSVKRLNVGTKSKISSAQTKTQLNVPKVKESVKKTSIKSNNANELTPDLELEDIKDSNTKPSEEKTTLKTTNRSSGRIKKEKRLTDFSPIEDKPHVTSSEKSVNSRKCVSNQNKRKMIDTKDCSSTEDLQTICKSNPKKRQSFKVEKISDRTELMKSSNLTKTKPKVERSRVSSNTDKSDDEFRRPPSPAPSHKSDTSVSSTSSRLRSSSSERPQTSRICILSTGLDDSQKKKLQKAKTELNANVVDCEWSEEVTHLVVGLIKDSNKKDRICSRNFKYLNALMANKWIVSFDWITDSIRSNRFIDEINYEIKGVKNSTDSNAPNKSRTTEEKLFRNRIVCFEGKFKIDVESLKRLVKIGGGEVIDSENETKPYESDAKRGKVKIIIVSEKVGLPNTQTGFKYVSAISFLDSVTNFQQI